MLRYLTWPSHSSVCSRWDRFCHNSVLSEPQNNFSGPLDPTSPTHPPKKLARIIFYGDRTPSLPFPFFGKQMTIAALPWSAMEAVNLHGTAWAESYVKKKCIFFCQIPLSSYVASSLKFCSDTIWNPMKRLTYTATEQIKRHLVFISVDSTETGKVGTEVPKTSFCLFTPSSTQTHRTYCIVHCQWVARLALSTENSFTIICTFCCGYSSASKQWCH